MNNTKQLSRLMVFATVANQGSITHAAKVLGITKSAVSQQIKALEKEMGISVLNRTTRGISTTALGEKLLSRCQLLKDQVELIDMDIANAKDNPCGRFTITFPHTLEATIVIPAIEQLCIEYPGLEPELIVNDRALDLVDDNLDVALYAGELADSSYRALPVGTITEIFCATPLFLNRNFIPQNLDQLCQLKWISTDWQHRKMAVYKQEPTNKHPSEKIMVKLNQFSKVNAFPTALLMAQRHLGMVLLPDFVAKPLIKGGEMVHILDNYTGPLWPLHTMHAYQGEKPIHLTRFHQLVCQCFNGLLN